MNYRTGCRDCDLTLGSKGAEVIISIRDMRTAPALMLYMICVIILCFVNFVLCVFVICYLYRVFNGYIAVTIVLMRCFSLALLSSLESVNFLCSLCLYSHICAMTLNHSNKQAYD